MTGGGGSKATIEDLHERLGDKVLATVYGHGTVQCLSGISWVLCIAKARFWCFFAVRLEAAMIGQKCISR